MSARYHDKVVANAVIGTTESEAWAVGKRDGVDVITSDPVYHNNSKYYAGLAEQHKSSYGRNKCKSIGNRCS